MGNAPLEGGPAGEKPSEGAPDPRRGPSGGVSSLGAAGKYAGLGLQFAISILLFLYAGRWVDKKLGLDGPFLITGVFVGAGAAFYSMYRALMADQRRDEEEKVTKAAKEKREKESGR